MTGQLISLKHKITMKGKDVIGGMTYNLCIINDQRVANIDSDLVISSTIHRHTSII